MNALSTDNAYRPDRMLRVLLGYVAISTLIFWLPAVRGFCDGSSYEWGLFGFAGRGTSGDYWLPLLGTATGLALQWLGWRGVWRPFYVMAALWLAAICVGSIVFAALNPQSFRFRGDTLGVDVSLVWVAPVVSGFFLLLVICWIWRHSRARSRMPVPSWGRRNWLWLLAFAAIFPVQLTLLRNGGPDSVLDQIGVVLAATQWFLTGLVFRPYEDRAERTQLATAQAANGT